MYYLKDVIDIYPLKQYVNFPDLTDYLSEGNIEKLNNSGFYNEDKILSRIQRKYNYNQIASSDVSQFYDLLNELIEENYSEYVMNLITIAEDYSIQNVDTQDIEIKHIVDTESSNLSITNDTPSNRLNIDNIKLGTSASNVVYDTEKGSNYTDSTHKESTSALNTTQSNIKAQLEINKLVQDSLNKFVNNLYTAFSIEEVDYYE